MRLAGLGHSWVQPTVHIVGRRSVGRRTVALDQRDDLTPTCQEQCCGQSGEARPGNDHSSHRERSVTSANTTGSG